MKYVYGPFVNNIIHDLKRIATTVKAQKQMFIRILVPNVIIDDINDSIPNGSFGNAMFKGRRVKLNDNIHFSTRHDRVQFHFSGKTGHAILTLKRPCLKRTAVLNEPSHWSSFFEYVV